MFFAFAAYISIYYIASDFSRTDFSQANAWSYDIFLLNRVRLAVITLLLFTSAVVMQAACKFRRKYTSIMLHWLAFGLLFLEISINQIDISDVSMAHIMSFPAVVMLRTIIIIRIGLISVLAYKFFFQSRLMDCFMKIWQK
ncbi:MAG: hypothetical protein FWE32_08935 [Oscillospiraceae bacterium]|nr:hypothetical protein [Oscillospiraceae bacterium]